MRRNIISLKQTLQKVDIFEYFPIDNSLAYGKFHRFQKLVYDMKISESFRAIQIDIETQYHEILNLSVLRNILKFTVMGFVWKINTIGGIRNLFGEDYIKNLFGF